MIFGIGTDLVEIKRIEDIFRKGSEFQKAVFTEQEVAYCDSRNKPAESYAARFAAKEAFFKALGTGWVGEMQFNEIEVLHEDSGKPFIKLHGNVLKEAGQLGIGELFVSLSHTATLANAVVLLYKKEPGE